MAHRARRRLGGVTAQIGTDGIDLFDEPRPELLAAVARAQLEPDGLWVNIEDQPGRPGFRSTQRLWMGAADDGVAVGTCPAELAPQARYLYGRGLGPALVTAAKEHGWTVDPQPHIAYRTSPPAKRLYMLPSPSIEALDYVASWQDKGALRRIGGKYAREDVEHELWPWLKQMGFADDGDDAVLQRFLDECLRRWPANMRPGSASIASGLPTTPPGSAPRSLRRFAASSTPCSAPRMSGR